MTASVLTHRGPAHRRRQPRGFTLIELLLVLVILAVLAAVVVPKFTKRSEQARLTAATTDISNLETALDAYEVDNGHYPNTQEGNLNALLAAPSGLSTWHGPYIKRLPNDPWGNAYVYRAPGQHNTEGYDLYSFGPDAQEGTSDDVTNWTTN